MYLSTAMVGIVDFARDAAEFSSLERVGRRGGRLFCEGRRGSHRVAAASVKVKPLPAGMWEVAGASECPSSGSVF